MYPKLLEEVDMKKKKEVRKIKKDIVEFMMLIFFREMLTSVFRALVNN